MSIDITTSIYTIISFLLLCVLLNVLLYKPIVGFMDKRDAKIAKGFEEEKNAKEKLEAAEGRMNEKFKVAAEEASAIVRESKQKDRAEYDAQIKEAHEQSSEIIRQAGDDIKIEEERQADEVDEQIPELVCILAEKVLGTSVPVSENIDIVKAQISENA